MISISKEAEQLIIAALKNNQGKFPRIVLKKGGCAGHMLCLVLEERQPDDTQVDVNGISFIVSRETLEYVGDISIELKNSLGNEIIIRNLQKQTCKCGKSFRA